MRNINYNSDLQKDLEDREFRREYLAACLADSKEALKIALRNIHILYRRAIGCKQHAKMREVAEMAISGCRDAAWDEREQPDADSILSAFRERKEQSAK